MKYTRFEDLPVWKEAVELAVKADALANHAAFRDKRRYRDQIEGAALSVSNNIAEGFERGTTQELLTFIYIARGSAGEVRSMMCVFERLVWCEHLKSQISNLQLQAESISRQLRAWADSLQNSPITGQRRLTAQTKRYYENRKAAAEMDREVQAAVDTAVRKQEEGRLQRSASSEHLKFEISNRSAHSPDNQI